MSEKDERRYWEVHFGITYSIVARDETHVREILMQADPDYLETLDWEGDPLIKEISTEDAGNRMVFDDARDGGTYPLSTFELGAWASSEY